MSHLDEVAFSARNVCKQFDLNKGLFKPTQTLHALKNISIDIKNGETLGIVGESGCGKSTLANILLGLSKPTAGEIIINGEPIGDIKRLQLARLVQPIFQDPYSSLNPSKTVFHAVCQPLIVHHNQGNKSSLVYKILDRVGIPRRLANAFPGELSGGQRQRVAIARALILNPSILICDEPTSALDVSVQAQVINLLLELKREYNLTMIFISHNLTVVEHLSDRVAVMYLGQIVEESTSKQLFSNPQHPYTCALLSAALLPKAGSKLPELNLGNAPADPFAIEKGCKFSLRCPIAEEQCRLKQPKLLSTKNEVKLRCLLTK